MRAPPALRFVLATRHDLRLGLHRLRLEGELAEIRAGDLRFSLAEARELFAAAGVELSEPAVVLLHERTEGWAAGLRLAALSLAGHPDPGRFAAEFSGSERTVAEYLLAEVLDRQSEQVRRLLLRTSVLERVSRPAGRCPDRGQRRGAGAAGPGGGERVRGVAGRGAGPGSATTTCSPSCCSWSCAAPRRGRSPGCTGWPRSGSRSTGSRWRRSGTPRRRRTGGWPPGCSPSTGPACTWMGKPRPSTSCWPGSRPGLARPMRSWRRWRRAMSWRRGRWRRPSGTWHWRSGTAPVPDGRRGQARLLVGIVRLLLARQRGNPPTAAEEAERLRALAEAPETAQPGLGEELRALALISLGITEYWAAGPAEAERHLEQGRILAHRIGRPFLEFTGLAYQAATEGYRSFARAEEYSMSAIELAERHGWTDEPAAGIA